LLTHRHSVFLHILLVERCCVYIQRRERSLEFARRVAEEEGALRAFVERWDRLDEVAAVSGVLGAEGPDPSVAQNQRTGEDLIDMEDDQH
jgi:hypothetical protein